MSYEVEYRAEFTDIEGCDWKVEILKDDYAGEVKTMQCSGNPLNIDFLTAMEKLIEAPVKGSMAIFNVLSREDFAYADLYTVSDFQYKVNIGCKKEGVLITGWNNSSYNTFTTDGADIISAINTGGYSFAFSSNASIKVRAGEKISMTFNCTINSGVGCAVFFHDGVDLCSDLHIATNGANTVTFEVLKDTEVYLQVDQSEAGNWSISDVIVERAERLFWSGWVVTGNYSEPYDGTSYVVSIAANDGLGVLKNIAFDDDGVYYDGRYLESEIIINILNKIGVSEFKEYINVYERSHSKGNGDSPLDQTALDVDVFQDMNCYEVLQHILSSYNAIIRQVDGIMTIIRPNQLVEDVIYGRHFTSGTEKTAISYLTDQNVSRATAVTDLTNVEGGMLMVEAPAKVINIYQDYGSKESWIDNWQLKNETFKDNQWDYWQKNYDYAVPLSNYMRAEKEGVAIININLSPASYFRQVFGQGMKYSTIDQFVLEFEYGWYNNTAGTKTNASAQLIVTANTSPTISQLQHKTSRVGYEQEVVSDLEWGSPPNNNRMVMLYINAPSGFSGWHTFKRNFTGIPDGTELTIQLVGSNYINSVFPCYKNVRFYMAENDAVRLPMAYYMRTRQSALSPTAWNKFNFFLATEKEYTVTNAIDNGVVNDYNVVIGDVKNVQADNVLAQYKGSKATYVGATMNISGEWSADDGDSYYDIVYLKALELARLYNRPRQLLSIPLIDKGATPSLNVSKRLKDPLNVIGGQPRCFAINGARFNVRDRDWEVDAIEVIAPEVIIQPLVVVLPSDEEETFTIESYSGNISIGSMMLTFEFGDPDGWSATEKDMYYNIIDAEENIVHTGLLEDVIDGGTFGATVMISREAAAGDEFTVVIGLTAPEVPVEEPVVTCQAAYNIKVWELADYGGTIDIEDDQLTFSFECTDGWDNYPGSTMYYHIYDSNNIMVYDGSLTGLPDIYDGGGGGDTVTIGREAESGDVFRVILGVEAS